MAALRPCCVVSSGDSLRSSFLLSHAFFRRSRIFPYEDVIAELSRIHKFLSKQGTFPCASKNIIISSRIWMLYTRVEINTVRRKNNCERKWFEYGEKKSFLCEKFCFQKASLVEHFSTMERQAVNKMMKDWFMHTAAEFSTSDFSFIEYEKRPLM